MSFSVGVAVLAAGKSKRLNLDISKILAPIQGKKLIEFVIESVKSVDDFSQMKTQITLVVGHLREAVEAHVSALYPEIKYAIQHEQKGTADAMRAYFNGHDSNKNFDYTLVLCGDTPLLRGEDLNQLFLAVKNDSALEAVVASFCLDNPFGYGRIVAGKKQGLRIVEEKDADSVLKKINEVNSGIYLIKTSYLLKMLESVNSNNAAQEYYLTDVFQEDHPVKSICFSEADSFLGINTLRELEAATRILRCRKVEQERAKGVIFVDSQRVLIDEDVQLSRGCIIGPNVCLHGKTQIGANVSIEMGVVVKDSIVDEQVNLLANSYLEGAHVRAGASIGPFARLRPAADIGEKCKIGNFVEIKKSTLEEGVKVSHLSYVGDAQIGAESNIGCGFITCNYDGINKHKTEIGKNSFIGSDCQMVAPVKLGNNTFVAAGSTITHDLNEGDFAIARSKQVNKAELAYRFLKKRI